MAADSLRVKRPLAPYVIDCELDAGSERVEDGAQLLAKLRRLDPSIRSEDYHCSGMWDVRALVEDVRLTESYNHDSLEASLGPIRREIKALVDRTPRASGAVRVSPLTASPVFLSGGETARDSIALDKIGIQRVVNCSPQTVKTGPQYYGPKVKYMELWEDDLLDYCVMQDFEAVWHFATAGEACLVHCEQGINRSGALAVALCMRMRRQEFAKSTPEEALRICWRHVVAEKGKVVTNMAFQRQLLVFARTGMLWFSTLVTVWRTPKERQMAVFRDFAEKVAVALMEDPKLGVPPESRWRMVIYVRDGAMRGESKMEHQYGLSTEDDRAKAARRIRSYAMRSLKNKRFVSAAN